MADVGRPSRAERTPALLLPAFSSISAPSHITLHAEVGNARMSKEESEVDPQLTKIQSVEDADAVFLLFLMHDRTLSHIETDWRACRVLQIPKGKMLLFTTTTAVL